MNLLVSFIVKGRFWALALSQMRRNPFGHGPCFFMNWIKGKHIDGALLLYMTIYFYFFNYSHVLEASSFILFWYVYNICIYILRNLILKNKYIFIKSTKVKSKTINLKYKEYNKLYLHLRLRVYYSFLGHIIFWIVRKKSKNKTARVKKRDGARDKTQSKGNVRITTTPATHWADLLEALRLKNCHKY